MITISSSSSIPICVWSGKSANQSISFSLFVAIGFTPFVVVAPLKFSDQLVLFNQRVTETR